MWLLIAFIAVPMIEIALFIQMGSWLGLWLTLAIVVITAVIGTFLVRAQGIHVVNALRHQMQNMKDPTEQLVHGAMILFSGALLLTPGFFTDAVGFALLVPGIRSRVFHGLRHRIRAKGSFETSFGSQNDDGIIDGDFEELKPEPRRSSGPSGWTKDRGSH